MDQYQIHFSCAITRDLARDPVSCPCNHLFDRPAIMQWLQTSRTCPVSRDFLSPTLLRTERLLALIIEQIFPLPPVVPELMEVEVENIPLPDNLLPALIDPFDLYPLQTLGLADLPPHVTTDGGRLNDFRVNQYNPHSNTTHIQPVVHRYNLAFIRRFAPDVRVHPHGFLHKYVYQSASDSLVAAALHNARQGLYIFDIFHLRQNVGGLHSFVIYSLARKADRTPNRLSRLRR